MSCSNIKSRNKLKFRGIVPAALAVAVLVGFGGFLGYRYLHGATSPATVSPAPKVNTVDYSPAKKSDNTANENRKSTVSNSNPNGSIAPTLNSSTAPPAFSVTVSRANGNGQSITAAATVNGSTTGTCVFNFSQAEGGSSDISSQPQSVQPSNQSAMCPPVSVQMPSKGRWYVSVTVTKGPNAVTSKWAANPVIL